MSRLKLLKYFLAVSAAVSVMRTIEVKAVEFCADPNKCGNGQCIAGGQNVGSSNGGDNECICNDCYTGRTVTLPASICAGDTSCTATVCDNPSDACVVPKKRPTSVFDQFTYWENDVTQSNSIRDLIVDCGAVVERKCSPGATHRFNNGQSSKVYRCLNGVLKEVDTGAAVADAACSYKYDSANYCKPSATDNDGHCNFPHGSCLHSVCICKPGYDGQFCRDLLPMTCGVSELVADVAASVHTSSVTGSVQLTASGRVDAEKFVTKVCNSGYKFIDNSGVPMKVYRCDNTAGALLNRVGNLPYDPATDTCIKECGPAAAVCLNGGTCDSFTKVCNCDPTSCYTGEVCDQLKICATPRNAVLVGDPSCGGVGAVMACLNNYKFSGSGTAIVKTHVAYCEAGGSWVLSGGALLPDCVACNAANETCVFSASGLIKEIGACSPAIKTLFKFDL